LLVELLLLRQAVGCLMALHLLLLQRCQLLPAVTAAAN
jgi:hypothetical protein